MGRIFTIQRRFKRFCRIWNLQVDRDICINFLRRGGLCWVTISICLIGHRRYHEAAGHNPPISILPILPSFLLARRPNSIWELLFFRWRPRTHFFFSHLHLEYNILRKWLALFFHASLCYSNFVGLYHLSIGIFSGNPTDWDVPDTSTTLTQVNLTF